jgi:hypothetical protein
VTASDEGRRTLRRGILALGLMVLGAGAASAQMTFDGNVVFNNNTSGTFAGQFVGAPQTDSTTCPAGTSAAQMATVQFTHNVYADPLLPNAPYAQNVIPNFRPSPGSPAWGRSLAVPNDGFFEQTCYSGALSPNPDESWIPTSTWGNNPSPAQLAVPNQGWCYFDSTGGHRHDLHLASNGDPNPRPLKVYAQADGVHGINLYSSQTWSPDTNYEVRGFLRVKDQATLTIPAGVVVLEDVATLGTIVVERGGKISAVGTQDSPIIITSNATPGTQTTGAGGGIYLLGRAKCDNANTCAGDSALAEGGAVGFYGGNDDTDNSGQLKYVRVEFAGKEVTPNNELNSFTFCGCGTQTKLEYLEAFDGVDDDFEFFGGTVDLKHAIGIDGDDDGFDWQMGYRGRGQFIIIRCTPYISPAGDQNGDKGIEADNNENAYTQTICSGRSNSFCSNFTMVGDKRSGPLYPGPTSAVNLRNGTAGTVINSICYNYKTAAVKVDVNETWRAHCTNVETAPAVVCGGQLDVPIKSGQVFVSRSAPNPFRNQVNFDFVLPKAGDVRVEIFSPSGQRVAALRPGTLPAGQHTLTWKVDRETPGGVYFYKVLTDGAESTGKIIRVD